MNIDLPKRKRVMERSQLLGHCICDAHRPCPCDMLIEQNLCPCAGERPDPAASEIKLLDFAHNAGCASKISPAELDAVLARLPAVTDPAVISGLAAADDAAIYRLTENLCLVQTVDVFTPCVDDARLFGQICAANCLSDIYAMGGTPRTALSVLAFPSEKLPGEVIFHMLSGAMEKFQEAGVALVGGHSVKDPELKLGFAITGIIDPAAAAALERPQNGDVLVLTKPLGTGVLAFARQIGREFSEGSAAAAVSMARLNQAAAEAMREAGASACTDVTGFGLFAHLYRMLRSSQLGAQVYLDALPAFPGAVEALRQGVIPGAIERNREYLGTVLCHGHGVNEALVYLGCDAQTSGGLLIAVPPDRLDQLRFSLQQRGVDAFVIGKITGNAGEIWAVPGAEILQSATPLPPPKPTLPMNPPSSKAAAHSESCCAGAMPATLAMAESIPAKAAPAAPVESTVAESQKAFAALMRSVRTPGALSEQSKELILFSLVVASRCESCFETHLHIARSLGLTKAQLDEAAWCAIALGGAPVKMFHQECCNKYCNLPETEA